MLRNAMPQIAVTNVDSEAKGSLARCLAASPAEYLAFLDLRDSYGPNYLEDLRLAAMYSGSDFLGKHSFYELAGPEVRSIRRPGNEYHRVDCVESATLLSRKSALSQEFLNQALDSRAFRVPGRLILSLDRFNYLQNAGGTRDCALEKGQHAELCV
jgi:hypothetical protein